MFPQLRVTKGSAPPSATLKWRAETLHISCREANYTIACALGIHYRRPITAVLTEFVLLNGRFSTALLLYFASYLLAALGRPA